MKFLLGDLLAFQTPKGILLGLVNTIQENQYVIALSSYLSQELPAQPSSSEFELFSKQMGMNEKILWALDTCMLDMEWGQPDVIQKIAHFPLSRVIGCMGFIKIPNVDSLVSYYEEGLQERMQATAFQPAPGFFEKKCFRKLADYLRELPPPEAFPLIRLYSHQGEEVNYWQAYGGSNEGRYGLVLHWGTIGGQGQIEEIIDKPLEELIAIYQASKEKKWEEGYAEWGEYERMILQFGTKDSWGAIEDLKFRNEITEYLENTLFWTANTRFSGGDIGSGTVNIFFDAISKEVAVADIVEALKQKGVDVPFLIAHEGKLDKEVPPNFGIKVLYPENYMVAFNY